MDKKNNVPEEKQPRFNKETLEAMRETLDIEAGKIPSKAYHSFAEYMADMDAMEDEEE